MLLLKIYNVYFWLKSDCSNKNVSKNSTHCRQLCIARLWRFLIFIVALKTNASQTNLFSKDKTILFMVMATLGKWVSARLLDLFVAQSGIKTHPSLCPGSGRDYCRTARRTRQSTRSPYALLYILFGYEKGTLVTFVIQRETSWSLNCHLSSFENKKIRDLKTTSVKNTESALGLSFQIL